MHQGKEIFVCSTEGCRAPEAATEKMIRWGKMKSGHRGGHWLTSPLYLDMLFPIPCLGDSGFYLEEFSLMEPKGKYSLYSRPSQTSTVSEKQNSNLAKPGQTPLNFIKEKPVTRTSCLGGKACCPLTLVLPPSSPTYATSFHDSSRGCVSTCCSLHLQS